MAVNASKVLDEIKKRVDEKNVINSCSGEGCSVDMEDVPSDRFVVNVENEFDFRQMRDKKRCDRRLFFISPERRLIAVPIELKSGTARESEVVEKLENSLEFAASIAPNPRILETEYCPILFHGRGINWRSPRGLKQLIVEFRGKKQVLIGKCGSKKNLANMLTHSGYL